MINLVLLRHGESIWNKENLFTGWADVDLSVAGENRGQRAGELLKAEGFSFDVAFHVGTEAGNPYSLDRLG